MFKISASECVKAEHIEIQEKFDTVQTSKWYFASSPTLDGDFSRCGVNKRGAGRHRCIKLVSDRLGGVHTPYVNFCRSIKDDSRLFHLRTKYKDECDGRHRK